MYHKETIHRNLQRATRLIRDRHKLPTTWNLRASTLDEIGQMHRHFQSLLDEKGRLTRDFNNDERLWILCESTLCKLSFDYYISRYCKIEGWDGRITRFTPNIAQRVILEMMAENEPRNVAQMFQLLKARQEGMTTLFQILGSHRVFFWGNVNFVTGSAAPEKSRAMVNKLKFLYDQLPWWLRPRCTTDRAGELYEYGDINSKVTVQWGNQKQGIGRGSTATIGHLSELASFLEPESLVDASLVRTLHENPFTLFGLESTAEGIGDWWHKTWQLNVKMEGRGLARFKPVFLPWYLARDLYPTEAWLRRRPVPADWVAPDYVQRHAEAAAVYVENVPYLRKALGAGWRMPREQQWFYHLEMEEAREKNQIHLFLQEMPATADEAFQNANPTVFSHETLIEVRTAATASRPLGAFQLVGPSVSPTYEVGRSTGKAVPLRCLDASGRAHESFELQPLAIDQWPDYDPNGRVYLWEWPQEGETYGIGVDPSEGVEQDSSVIQVIKKATPDHADEQVAEFASNKVSAKDLWSWVFALAHFYTVAKAGARGWNWPRVVVEINIAAGELVQTELLKRGWGHFHQRYDPTKTGSTKQRARALTEDIGWRTTAGSRPKLIAMARSHVRDGLVKIRSPWLSGELDTLEYNLDRKRIEASQGNHDDRFVALGILLASWYDPSIYGTAPSEWQAHRREIEELARHPVYSGDLVVGQAARRYRSIAEPAPADSRGFYAR